MSSYKHEILITHYCIDTDTLSEHLRESIAAFRSMKARVTSLQAFMLLRQADDNITVLLLQFLRLQEAELEKLLIAHCYLYRRYFEYMLIACPDLLLLNTHDTREAHYGEVEDRVKKRHTVLTVLATLYDGVRVVRAKIDLHSGIGGVYNQKEVLLVVDPFEKTVHPVKYDSKADGEYFITADPMNVSMTKEFDVELLQPLINENFSYEVGLMQELGAVFRPEGSHELGFILSQLTLSLN